VTFFILLRV